MNRLVSRTLVLAVALAAGSASAQDYYEPDYGYGDDRYEDRGYDDRGYDAGYGGQDAAYDMARVTRVDPIVEPGRPVSRRECWNEPAPSYAGRDRYDPYADPRHRDPRYSRDPRRPSGSGAVIGAIVGGVLGNSVGDGDGRQAATVVGAVIGGAIGNNVERNSRERAYRTQDAGYYETRDVQRCRVVSDASRERQVVGYRVGYEYAGRDYETVTDYHPGREIRVRVHVTPEG